MASPVLNQLADSGERGFSSFFLAKESSLVLKLVPAGSADLSRHKRHHRKSRRGCDNCRKRHVKCDEKVPSCSNCLRRNELCKRRAFVIQQCQSPLPRTRQKTTLPPLLNNPHSPVNMFHMKLFHHFETSTRHTICFSSVWKEALGWSLEYEALMQAILSISAQHLAYLCPNEPAYGTAAAFHLAQAVGMFRKDINQKFTASNVDFFMATSILIYFQLWTATDYLVTNSAGLVSLELSKDPIFRLAGGLVEVFKSSGPVLNEKPSAFVAEIMHSPRQLLNSAAFLSEEIMTSFQSFFSYTRPVRYEQLQVSSALKHNSAAAPEELMASLVSEEDIDLHDVHKDVVSRLVTLLLFLPDMRVSEVKDVPERLMPDLVRYAFTFSILIYAYAEKILSTQDPKGLLILYHFYRAVRILLGGPNCWWAHKRARTLELLLEEKLSKQISRAL